MIENKTNSESHITIVHLDDDPLELKNFARSLISNKKNIPFIVHSYLNVTEFRKNIKYLKNIDFAILDIYLSDNHKKTGLEVVSELKNHHPNSIVLMSSNLDDPDSVLQSLKAGADEFVSKKISIENIVEKILSIRKKTIETREFQFPDNLKLKSNTHGFSGETMRKICQRVPQIINSAISSVYIEGESGTGKEVVADLFGSFARNTPFVKLNCGSIAPSLLESELFGYVKGAFTGALSNKAGIIETASGGWVFLDEVASLSKSAQVALLRVLENQEVIRLGESHSRKINVRFIAASNVCLSHLVEEGKFRNDLWQRLCETEIILKPLRERRSEIPELIEYFCKNMRGGPYQIEKTAMNVLSQMPWDDGNVRELRNCLRAMTENQNNGILSPMGIPERILIKSKLKKNLTYQKDIRENHILVPIKDIHGNHLKLKDMHELLLNNYFNMLKSEKVNLTALAETLGIARSTIQIKFKKYLKKK